MPGGEHDRVAERAPEPGLGAGGDRVAADVDVDDQVAAEQPGGGADPLGGALRRRR